MVPMAGLEPARAFYGPTDFKSVASAISPHRLSLNTHKELYSSGGFKTYKEFGYSIVWKGSKCKTARAAANIIWDTVERRRCDLDAPTQ
jgi:hypothetical protein